MMVGRRGPEVGQLRNDVPQSIRYAGWPTAQTRRETIRSSEFPGHVTCWTPPSLRPTRLLTTSRGLSSNDTPLSRFIYKFAMFKHIQTPCPRSTCRGISALISRFDRTWKLMPRPSPAPMRDLQSPYAYKYVVWGDLHILRG